MGIINGDINRDKILNYIIRTQRYNSYFFYIKKNDFIKIIVIIVLTDNAVLCLRGGTVTKSSNI